MRVRRGVAFAKTRISNTIRHKRVLVFFIFNQIDTGCHGVIRTIFDKLTRLSNGVTAFGKNGGIAPLRKRHRSRYVLPSVLGRWICHQRQ
ncbi:hypothetical protein KCP75_19820 [Salmonella enterica subsp. enterica]|nr:hypothetical protein KCP75_19820 [Salmonella enterica subsp. enterica]